MQKPSLICDTKVIRPLRQILPGDRCSFRIILKSNRMLYAIDIKKTGFFSRKAIDCYMILRRLREGNGLNDRGCSRNATMYLNNMEFHLTERITVKEKFHSPYSGIKLIGGVKCTKVSKMIIRGRRILFIRENIALWGNPNSFDIIAGRYIFIFHPCASVVVISNRYL